MAAENPDVEADLRRLDGEIKLEELRKLRASRRFMWVNPAALGIMLPLIGAFGLWVAGEIKSYNAAYQAQARVGTLEAQVRDLEARRSSLNLDLMALLSLKAHYSDENKRLSGLLSDRQALLDRVYLRALWSMSEALYALDHAQMGWEPLAPEALDALAARVAVRDAGLGAEVRDLVERYRLFAEMSDVSDEVLGAFLASLGETSPSAEALRLQWQPEGAVLAGRQVMADWSAEDPARRFYDVGEGRYLSAEEAAAAQ